MKNIAIATYGSIGVQVIRKVFSLGYKPQEVIIITHDPMVSENIGFINYLDYWGIRWFLTKDNMDLLKAILLTHKTEVLLNIAYKYIYREPVLSMGIPLINMHPGLLPYYKGWLSVPWSIFNDEEVVGYTYHLIDEKIDHGDILSTDTIAILDTSTAFDLHHRLHDLAIDELEYILAGLWRSEPQPKGGTYYKRMLPNNGYIDRLWAHEQIERFIRAMYFPPHKGAILRTKKGEIEIISYEQYLKVTDEEV